MRQLAPSPAGHTSSDLQGSVAGRPARPVSVTLVNDYELVLRGLHAMLAPFAERIRIVEYEVGGTPEHPADVALFDTFAGRRDALGRAAQMLREGHVQRVVLYTWDASAAFLDIARHIGVSAVVSKTAPAEKLVSAIERVAHGDRFGLDHVSRGTRTQNGHDELTTREREVLALLALGRSNRQIGDELFISIDTVKTYVRRIFTKLGVRNRTQAAFAAVEHGVEPPRAHHLVAQLGH